jgi:hypothetical protein
MERGNRKLPSRRGEFQSNLGKFQVQGVDFVRAQIGNEKWQTVRSDTTPWANSAPKLMQVLLVHQELSASLPKLDSVVSRRIRHLSLEIEIFAISGPCRVGEPKDNGCDGEWTSTNVLRTLAGNFSAVCEENREWRNHLWPAAAKLL